MRVCGWGLDGRTQKGDEDKVSVVDRGECGWPANRHCSATHVGVRHCSTACARVCASARRFAAPPGLTVLCRADSAAPCSEPLPLLPRRPRVCVQLPPHQLLHRLPRGLLQARTLQGERASWLWADVSGRSRQGRGLRAGLQPDSARIQHQGPPARLRLVREASAVPSRLSCAASSLRMPAADATARVLSSSPSICRWCCRRTRRCLAAGRT